MSEAVERLDSSERLSRLWAKHLARVWYTPPVESPTNAGCALLRRLGLRIVLHTLGTVVSS
jgi:hypothetical protein